MINNPGGMIMKKRLVAFLLVLVILIPCAASAAGWYRLTEKKRLFNLPDYDSKVMDSYRTDWALSINSAVDSTWASVTFSNGVTGYMERKYLVLCKSSTAWISAGTANLKHGPGSSFATVGSLSRGDSVTVLTQGNNWSFVSSSAGTGYIANSSLSDSKVSGSSGSSGKSVNYTAWVTSRGDPVGLRSAPVGTNDYVFQTYVPGTKVTVLKELSGFSYVRIAEDGQEGYMRSKYLSTVKPAQASSKEAQEAAASAAKAETSGFPFTAYARESGGEAPQLYRGEGLGWAHDPLQPGTAVTVIGSGSDIYWFQVSVNGTTGYMPSKFLSR